MLPNLDTLRCCEKCQKPMTEHGQPRIEGVRKFQARGRCSRCYQTGLESGELVARKRNYFDKEEIQCAKCLKVKNVTHFKKHANTSSGYEYVCRFCGKLAERYGITDKTYRDLFDAQQGLCKICTEPIALYARATHVDHDHACCAGDRKGCGNCVRGLLCHYCNIGLGNFKESVDNLQNAIDYLKGFNEIL